MIYLTRAFNSRDHESSLFDGFWCESAWECVLACGCVTQTTICCLTVTLSLWKGLRLVEVIWQMTPLTPDPPFCVSALLQSPPSVRQSEVKTCALVWETDMADVCHLLLHVLALSSPWNSDSCRSVRVVVTLRPDATSRSEVTLTI